MKAHPCRTNAQLRHTQNISLRRFVAAFLAAHRLAHFMHSAQMEDEVVLVFDDLAAELADELEPTQKELLSHTE